MDEWGQPKRPAEAAFVDLDTRLLRTLLTIIDLGSVSRAGAVLGQSQPAVSQTLRRMRDLTGDPLLVRSGAKLVPTERALAMLGPLRSALANLDAAIRPARDFDPASDALEVRIAAADCLEAVLLPRLITRIRRAAPRARIMTRAITADFDYAEALEKGEVDAVIANWPSPPGNLRTVRLLSDDMVCIFGPDHPLNLKRAITMDDYMALEHIAPMALSKFAPGPIDGRLAELGLTRDIRVMAPEFNLVPYTLIDSDLVFTSSESFARHYRAFLPIRTLPAPQEFGRMRFYLLWHERAQGSAANGWLRAQIGAVTHQIQTEIATYSGRSPTHS